MSWNVNFSKKRLDEKDIVWKLKDYLFTDKMNDIIEMTFAYTDIWNGHYFNRTLFSDFAGLSIKNTQKELYTSTYSQLWIKKQFIQTYRKELLDNVVSEKTQLLLGTLEYIEKLIDLTVLGLPFEIEKMWYSIDLSSSEIQQRIQQMESIEKDLFGWNIRDNPLEVVNCYRDLKKKIDKKMPQMNPKQIQLCQKVLQSVSSLSTFIDINWIFQNKKKDERTVNYKKIFEDNKTLLEKRIPRGDYIKIFQLVLDMYDIKRPIVVDERGSVYDGDDALHIPKWKDYDTLSLGKLLSLISHEIERHMISLENNDKNVWWFRWWYNLFIEEGSAMILEWALEWKSLHEYEWVSVSLPNILVWELVDWNKLKEFMSIFAKKDVDSTWLRRKRLYPIAYRWAQHKDTTYTRWPKEVISYLYSWGDVKDLYMWRLQKKDILDLKSSWKISEENTIYPKLVSEVILYKLIHWSISDAEFKDFIVGKYNFLSENTIRDKMNNFTNKQKHKLIEILRILKK